MSIAVWCSHYIDAVIDYLAADLSQLDGSVVLENASYDGIHGFLFRDFIFCRAMPW